MQSLVFGKIPNITGTWSGRLSGTSLGTANFNVTDENGRVFGQCRLVDDAGGSFEYDVQGVLRIDEYTLFLSPRSGQVAGIGTVGARCRLTDNGQLVGTWNTGGGQTGAFTAERSSSVSGPHGPKGSAVFLVHGHDEASKEKVARFLEKLGLSVIVLHEMVSRGLTIIEKLEDYAEQAGFAVVLATPDDIGYPMDAEVQRLPRPRQNVVLELGYFVGKLSRSRVFVLSKGSLELPSDILGVVYHDLDANGGWRLTLARELKQAGYEIDLNRIDA